MTLSFYLARRFFWVFMAVIAIFAGLIFLMEMAEQLRRFAGTNAGLGKTGLLALLRTPGALYQILPLLSVLAALALFLGLARNSELVAIRAAGRSGLAILWAPVLCALVLGVATVAIFGPIVAATSRADERMSESMAQGARSVTSISPEGLWLRQGDSNKQTVIHAMRASLDGQRLIDVSFLSFGASGSPITRIEARTAYLTPDAWVLSHAKEWQFDRHENPERESQTLPEMTVETDLTQAQISDSFGAPQAVGIWNQPAFIATIEKAGFSALRHRVWFQMQLALPLFLAAMVITGAAFSMRHSRMGATGLRVLSAVLAGFGVFFLRRFAQVLAENGQIPVALAAWTPPLVAIFLSASLILQQEEG